MLRAVEMLSRVLVLRRVATAHVSAFKAQAQMHPAVPGFGAVFTNVLFWARNSYLIKMCAL
jgi:hypothetical protein